MQGRRSLGEDLEAFDGEIERTFRQNQRGQLSITNPLFEMADENLKTLKEYYTPNAYISPSCIRVSAATAGNFEIKPNTIQMLPSFYGRNHEDPYRHVDEFLEICTTFKLNNLTDDAVRMRLFPFSLKDKAKEWLYSLEPESITSWAKMQQDFLKKYFPIGKTNQMRDAITTFTQQPTEQFHESWDRLKDLLRKCPHHAVPRWQLVQRFYRGLTDQNRHLVDASCGGTFLLKNENEAWELFENLSENSLQHTMANRNLNDSSSSTLSKGGMYEVKQTDDLSNQVATLSRKIDQILSLKSQTPAHTQEACVLCLSPMHSILECPSAPQFPELVQEHVNAAQTYARTGNDPFSNTYNPGWRNHPNFSWRPQNQGVPFTPPQRANFQNNPPGFQQPTMPSQFSQPSRNSEFEDKVLSALQSIQAQAQSQAQLVHSHTQSIAKLESQIGQLANSMSKREEGRLPSQPMNNPKGQFMLEQQTTSNEHVQAITTLQSGKQIENPVGVDVREDKDQEKISNPENDETLETPPNSNQSK